MSLCRAAGAGITNLVIRSDRKIFDRSDFTWTIVPIYVTRYAGMISVSFHSLHLNLKGPMAIYLNAKPSHNSLVELNVGLMCHSLPVVCVLFMGRFTDIGKSISSWIRQRRCPRPGAGESSSNLAPEDSVTPQISPTPNDAGFSGMRKFGRNISRSRAQSSARRDAAFMTFNDLTSTDLSYHLQLKAIQSKRNERSYENRLS